MIHCELETIRCIRCNGLFSEDEMRVLPGKLVCVNCYNEISKNNTPTSLKEKLKHLKPKLRKINRINKANPKPKVVKITYESLGIIKEYVKSRNTWKLFTLPYPIIQSTYEKYISSEDPVDWLLNPKPLPELNSSLLEHLSSYGKVIKFKNFYNSIINKSECLNFTPTIALREAELNHRLLQSLQTHTIPSLSNWSLEVTATIYEQMLLNRQISLSLLAPHIVNDIENEKIGLTLLEKYTALKSDAILRCICQNQNISHNRCLSGSTILKLMNFYKIDTDAVLRAKLRLADSALLNCS